MPIVGFNFNKVSVERTAPVRGKIKINNNIAIKNVEGADLNLGQTRHKIVKFKFEFSASYEPKIAEILLKGDVLYLDKPQVIADLEKGWKKDKKIPKETLSVILNHVLNKCNIEAVVLGRELNLPPPIPMPKVTQK